MAGSIEHVSRHRLNGAELQVISDSARDNNDLTEAEKNVVRRFSLHGGWPHRHVNLFVFDNLTPVVEQLRRSGLASAEGLELERKPMVHIYNMRDLAECSVFVNRGLMKRLGLWDDPLAIEGLLAHEHAHPMAENGTTKAARSVSVRLSPQPDAAHRAVAASVEHMAHELCLHAPHEVFTNELAIRAGFGLALQHLNLVSLSAGRAGMDERARLSEGLQAKVGKGHLRQEEMELVLLAASMEAHIRLALETAAFVRAGAQQEAEVIEARARAEVFSCVEPEISALYRMFRDRYLELTPYMDRDAVCEWAEATFAPVLEEMAYRGARFGAEFYYGKGKS